MKAERYFYLGAGILMFVLMLIGFQSFYLDGKAYPGREIPPPIRTLVYIHGISMTAWMILYCLQSTLIITRYHRTHMFIGRLAALSATAITITGLMLAVRSTSIMPPGFALWGLSGKEFMAVPFLGILLFAAMVGAGIWFRRKPKIHRPMMLFATLNALSAALARIDAFSRTYQGTTWERIFGPFLLTILIGAALVLLRMLVTRKFDKWFTISFAIMALALLLTIVVARTALWVKFVDLLIS
ncbi:MAG: hypothetical protein R3B84_13050 [Zavarzinella sp.]